MLAPHTLEERNYKRNNEKAILIEATLAADRVKMPHIAINFTYTAKQGEFSVPTNITALLESYCITWQ